MENNSNQKQDCPLVFVRCLTFNHEAYIEDALNGFVMQQTNFPFVVTIVNDASPDNTKNVIEKFITNICEASNIIHEQTSYADIIKSTPKENPNCLLFILNLYENHFLKKSHRPYYQEYVDKAKYWAECEGDDYWTDPLKLQKQVDILEADESLMLCCTNCSVVDNHSMEIQAVRGGVVKNDVQGRYNLRDFFRDNHQYPTLSVVYRRTHTEEISEKYARTHNAFLGDWTLWICLLIYGDAYFLNEVTGAYRINPTSVTHSNVNARRLGLAKANFKLLPAVASILPNEFQDIKDDLTNNTSWMWFNLANAYRHQRQYIRMLGCVIVCCIKNPKMLFNKIRNRK
jgi:glycosyltransferase involved in cell wall biosynthesis